MLISQNNHKHRYELDLLWGGLSALAFAPLYFLPGFILGVIMLMRALENSSALKEKLLHCFLYGVGFYSIGLYWIYYPFQVTDLGLLGIPAVLFLAMGLSLFFLPLAFLPQSLNNRSLLYRLCFAGLWALCEFIRGIAFTGFPWNLAAYIFGAYTYGDFGLSILQVTSVIGSYGLSLLAMVFIALISVSNITSRFFATLLALCVIGFGYWRLNHNPTELTTINLRLIQPSISQKLKWDPEHIERNFDLQMALSSLEAERPLKAVIWPEASVPFQIEKEQDVRELLAKNTPQEGYLLIGGPRFKDPYVVYNSIFIVNDKAQIIDSYDKVHLVPFGEFMPLKSILPLKKLTAGTLDFSHGEGLKTLKADGLPSFSPLICFEAVFPGETTHEKERPEWLLNITNDAWFGITFGPYQHFASVRLRAIEEGLPLVRVANNGISGVVDSCGRILHKLALDDIGFIDFELPKPLPQTFFSKYKNVSFYIGLILLFLYVFLMSYFSPHKKFHRGRR